MPRPTDLRGLEPPEPLVRILEAIESGGPGPHVFLLSREPWPLHALMKGSGWRTATREVGDEGWEVTLSRDPADP